VRQPGVVPCLTISGEVDDEGKREDAWHYYGGFFLVFGVVCWVSCFVFIVLCLVWKM
jgi:hypothetical protein